MTELLKSGFSRAEGGELPEAFVFAKAASELAGQVEDDPFVDQVLLRQARGEISGSEAREILRAYTLGERV